MLTFDHIRNTQNTIDEDVLTLYLQVDNAYQPNQAERPAWRIHIENALRDVRQNHLAEDNDTYKAIEERTRNYFETYEPSSKSLVLFVGANTMHTHELPITLENNHAFGNPMLVPLMWAVDEFERYLVVMVDQEEARFVSAYLGNATVNDEMTIDFDQYDFRNKNYINRNVGGSDQNIAQGSKKDQFDDMHQAHLERFYIDIAESIREALDDMQSERVVLGGNTKAANMVKDKMHQSVQKKVVGIMNLPMSASEGDIAEAILEPALAYERAEEMELVEEVIGFAKSGGRGALGEEDIRQAFIMQQVELLVIPFPVQDDDRDLIYELTTEALTSGADIELVHGAPAAKLRHEAPLAARLYYAINTPEA